MKNVIFGLLEQALSDFYRFERRNFELDVHEIAHGHRLAYYLERIIRRYDKEKKECVFRNYSIDIEFNKTEGGKPKEVFRNGKYHQTRCDILIHSKGRVPEQENLLIIELKKRDSDDKVENDINEIKRMVSPSEKGSKDAQICGTLLGVFLRIYPNQYKGYKYWYQDGDVKDEYFEKKFSE